MNNIDIEKNHLRKIFLAKRKSLDALKIDYLSQKIAKNFIEIITANKTDINNKIFGSYIPTKFEAKPFYIENFLRQNNCIICYPKINNTNQTLDFISPNSTKDFSKNQFFPQIIEPNNGELLIPDNLLVPLLAFDKYSQRLGMGKGFYDRTINALKKQNPKLNTFGVAFKIQQSNQALPTSIHDYTLDFIVSA